LLFVITSVVYAKQGPGLFETPLYVGGGTEADGGTRVGTVSIWNTREKLLIHIYPINPSWKIYNTAIYVGTDPVPTTNAGVVNWPQFPYDENYQRNPAATHALVLDLEQDLGFSWGEPWEDQRVQKIAVHAMMLCIDDDTQPVNAWAKGPEEYDEIESCTFCWGWWFNYEMAHPKRGHFIDSPVLGLSFETPTHDGLTDESGGFDYFPGERVILSIDSVDLGTALADHKISPLDIFENADTDDPRVINMARLLQSLDADASPQDGISITPGVATCLEQVVETLGLTSLDFSDDAQIESVIQGTILCAPELEAVSAEQV